MGLVVALIALAVRCVDRHIDGNAISADQLQGKIAGDLRAVLGADLGRQGEFPLTGRDGVVFGSRSASNRLRGASQPIEVLTVRADGM